MRLTSPRDLSVCVAILTTGILLNAGCSSTKREDPPAATKRQSSTNLLIPVIERLQVNKTGEEGQSNARLMATVSADSTDVIQQGYFTLQPDPKDPARDVVLSDDGSGADDKAGDLIFSGYLSFDFDWLVQQNARIDALGGNAVVTRFNGRVAVQSDAAPLIDEKDLEAGVAVDVEPLGLAAAISVPHSLIINDPSVVGDPDRTFTPCQGGTPMGPWTFGHLFAEMVNQPLTGNDPSDVARAWLESWLSNQELHFASAIERLNVQNVINDWETASGGGQLDLSLAPFRLVAIVNRMDLHSAVGYGSGTSGELRFVFALEDSGCGTQPFLVIFEYGNLPEACDDMTALAKRWVDLASHPIGSTSYLDELQKLTDEVVTAGVAPGKPNESALNQLRTNDFVLDSPWQLREFMIDSSGFLVPDTVKRTPDISLDGTTDLATAIDDNLPTVWPNPPSSMPNILTGSFDPIEYPVGTFIRAMASDVPSPSFCFTAPIAGNSAINADDARFEYSSNTCAGCHGGDMNSGGNFTHIDENGNLSAFLSGPHSESDCVSGTVRSFDEPARRAQILDALANNACERLAMLKKLEAEH